MHRCVKISQLEKQRVIIVKFSGDNAPKLQILSLAVVVVEHVLTLADKIRGEEDLVSYTPDYATQWQAPSTHAQSSCLQQPQLWDNIFCTPPPPEGEIATDTLTPSPASAGGV